MTLVHIDMSIESMVTFMVKWAIASIPALIIIVGVVFFVSVLLGVLFGGLASISNR